jgi:hypothetical protein
MELVAVIVNYNEAGAVRCLVIWSVYLPMIRGSSHIKGIRETRAIF